MVLVRLPDEQWKTILSYLNPRDLIIVQRVSKKWRRMSQDVWTSLLTFDLKRDFPRQWRSLKHRQPDEVEGTINIMLQNLGTNLEKLSLGLTVTDKTIKIICYRFPKLTVLKAAVTDEGYSVITQTLLNLKSLGLDESEKILDESLRLIPLLENLQQLSLSGCFLVSDNLSELSKLPQLSHLDLSYCWQLLDKHMSFLLNIPTLESLDLSHCRQLTDETCRLVLHLPQLQTLRLVANAFTDNGLDILSELKTIQRLTLARLKNITDDGLAAISQLQNLMKLELASLPHITERGFDYLKALTSLRELSLSGCPVTGSNVHEFSKLGNLKELSMIDCNGIDNDSIKQLAASKLDTLIIVGCDQVTEEGIINLKHLAALIYVPK